MARFPRDFYNKIWHLFDTFFTTKCVTKLSMIYHDLSCAKLPVPSIPNSHYSMLISWAIEARKHISYIKLDQQFINYYVYNVYFYNWSVEQGRKKVEKCPKYFLTPFWHFLLPKLNFSASSGQFDTIYDLARNSLLFRHPWEPCDLNQRSRL